MIKKFLYSPVVGDLPDIVTPEALKQIPPSGYTTDGKAYVIAISPPPKEEVIHCDLCSRVYSLH